MLAQPSVLAWDATISREGQDVHRQALRKHEELQTRGGKPSKQILLSVLKACGSLVDLEYGRKIHADMVAHNWVSDVFLGTALVGMYARCGSMVDAERFFHGLAQPSVVLWNAMISGYVQQDQCDKALQLYRKMVQGGVKPDNRTFVSVLKASNGLAGRERSASRKTGWLHQVKEVQSEVVANGYQMDLFVGNSLVSAYLSCGSTRDAERVFDRMGRRDVVTWTAMIAGFAQEGDGEKALDFYARMQEDGIVPNDRTFVSVLKACGSLAGKGERQWYLEKAKDIHAEVLGRGLQGDVFVGASLVSMYVKLGSMVDAQDVFDMLPQRNVVAWNAMLSGYAQHEQGDEAFQLYDLMQAQGLRPNDRTFVSMLKVCGGLAVGEETTLVDGELLKLESLQRGLKVHAELVSGQHQSDLFVGATIVDMYVKCGSVVHAELVFHTLPTHDVVSWTAMITGYAQQAHPGGRALELYDKMQAQGMKPDKRTFVSVLKSCGSLAALERPVLLDGQRIKARCLHQGKKIHADVVALGLESETFVGAALIDMYANCGSLLDARHVFDSLPSRDVVSWNTLIVGYAQQQQGEKALQLYKQMFSSGIKPDAWTFVSVLKAWSSTAATEDASHHASGYEQHESLRKVQDIHEDIVRAGYGSDLFVANTLINLYANHGSMIDACRVFDLLPVRDEVSWTTLIAGYAALEGSEEAMLVYQAMRKQGISPNKATFLSILRACSNRGCLNMCSQIHSEIVEAGIQSDAQVATTLIHAYGKCGSMVDARNVFNTMARHDVFSWSALIAGYARQGEGEKSLECFEEMQLAGIPPDGVTYLSVLVACSHSGLVKEGLECFEAMGRDHSLTVTQDHYVALVDILGRAGMFTEVETALTGMTVEPNLALWLCLLGACRKHSNVDLGRKAFERAVALDPGNSAPYLVMSNIFADANMMEDARKILKLGRTAVANKKQPGLSWVEHNQTLHSFLVGDKSHPAHSQVIEKVKALHSEINQEQERVSAT